MARYKNKGPPRRSHKGNRRGRGESFSASRRFASISWHEALLLSACGRAIALAWPWAAGNGIEISVPFLSMFIRYRIILTTI